MKISISKKDIKQIIKEELNAIIGEGRMGEKSVEVQDELRMIMTKFGVDIGGLRGILSDMEKEARLNEDDGHAQAEPKFAKHDWLAMASRDEDDNSMIGRVANAILQELLANTQLSEEESKMHLEEIRGFAQEYIMPIYNQIQTSGMDKAYPPPRYSPGRRRS